MSTNRTLPRAARQPFGTVFTPSMMTATYSPERGWGEFELGPRRPLVLDPATVALHYGQTAFEGLMAYRQPNGDMAIFRAADHAARWQRSCERLAIPPIDIDRCVESWREFVRAEQHALPDDPEVGLYLRPLIFGSDAVLGARPSTHFQMVLLGVESWFDPRRRFEVLITQHYVRTTPGGIGMAKTPGNYGAAMLAQQYARERGCDQVLWLDAGRRRWIEELVSMNVFFVLDEVLVTPPLTDTILAGVTRDSVLRLAEELDVLTDERPVALEELTAAVVRKGLTEAFACSTGVGIASIRAWHLDDERHELPAETPVADQLRERLVACQRGLTSAHPEWRTPV